MRPKVLSVALLRKAERHFRATDPVMGRLVDIHGRCPLIGPPDRDFFRTLARSIISQQLSSKAAETIARRVLEVVLSFTAESIAKANPANLRAAGLSNSKVRYIQELAGRVVSGALDLECLPDFTDEEVLECLTEVPGIGRWTAEMFLIFALKRPDILSLGDAGLRRSVRILYGAELEDIAETWRPFRSLGSWYLWRHLDG